MCAASIMVHGKTNAECYFHFSSFFIKVKIFLSVSKNMDLQNVEDSCTYFILHYTRKLSVSHNILIYRRLITMFYLYDLRVPRTEFYTQLMKMELKRKRRESEIQRISVLTRQYEGRAVIASLKKTEYNTMVRHDFSV